jgi:ectoine hydroxylase-related dioxygenase (phytanoyl-CoA dioxygenase family)
VSAAQFIVDTERYARDGYLVRPGVVSADRLPALRRESDRLRDLAGAQPDVYATRIEWEAVNVPAAERAQMRGVIRKLEPVVDLSAMFAELARSDVITEPATAILGEPVVLFEDKLNLKPPGGSTYPWHQDWSCCWRAHTDRLVTCFIYLDDADAGNGCLEVVPGSHVGKPTLPFRQGSRFEVDPAHVDASRVRPVPLAAGDMIVFDPYLLHYSDRNRTPEARRTIIYTYNPAGLGTINEGRFPA